MENLDRRILLVLNIAGIVILLAGFLGVIEVLSVSFTVSIILFILGIGLIIAATVLNMFETNALLAEEDARNNPIVEEPIEEEEDLNDVE